jgi:S-DNA-T family DNA segregation ATPase FtsK/SpoIIIE
MYDRALEIVAETRNASISYIQRRLKVGYNRAARMVEQMEADGVVGPQEGTKPRDVYVRPVGALE